MKKGKSRTFHGLDPEISTVIAVCLGKKGTGYNDLEGLDEGRDQIRNAVAHAVRQLRDIGETEVEVDPCGDVEAAAEGSLLSLHTYNELKSEKKQKPKVNVSCYTEFSQDRDKTSDLWTRGVHLAEGQMFASKLMEMPANKLTPTIFSDIVSERLSSNKQISVTVRDKEWIKSQKMEAFLSVAKGSEEPPVFLELEYKGNNSSDTPPVALVGKGVTFDSGGISIKPSSNMDLMRADMGGAACVAGSLLSVAKLGIPINIKAFIPLCENMPSGTATRPGDVVTAMNGKTIQVDNTDAEGRLILADALCYADTFNPSIILDMATLTGAIDVALGSAVTGVFSTSTPMWELLQKAGTRTGDRVWRMPLLKHYTKQVTESQLADVNNIGKIPRSGGACTAAAFLREFVKCKQWMHLDIAGVMLNKSEIPYLRTGMSGRPTRTIVEFLKLLSTQS